MEKSYLFLLWVTVYFPSQAVEYRSYQNTILCKAATEIKYPKTVAEVVEIVQFAISNNLTVKALGNFHSMTDVICTEGIPISMKHFNTIKINPDRKTVLLGAGVKLMDAIDELHRNDLCLGHVPAYGGISIGGAMGTGARGSSLKTTNSVSELVVGVEFIDGVGKYHNVQLDEASAMNKYSDKADIIRGFRVHLGLLGIILSATLEVKKDYKVKIMNTEYDHSFIFKKEFMEEAEKHDVFQVFWYPNINKVIISNGSQVDTSKSLEDKLGYNNCSTNMIPGIDHASAHSFTVALELAQKRRINTELKLIEFASQEFFFKGIGPYFKRPFFYERSSNSKVYKNPAVGYIGYMITNTCDGDGYSCPWNHKENSILPVETALAIKLSNLTQALKDIKQLFDELKSEANDPIFPLLGIFIRFSGNFSWENYMAIEDSERTAYIEFINIQRYGQYSYNESRMGMAAYQGMGQLLLDKYKGRPHWGKNGLVFHSRKRFENFFEIYPKTTKKFKTLMKTYDPNGLFLNKFGRRLLNQSDEYDTEPKLKRCALWDYCFCSNDTDCEVGRQVCTNKTGNIERNLRICKDLNWPIPI